MDFMHMHVESHFQASDTVRDIVIGMADGLTVPFALAAGLTGDRGQQGSPRKRGQDARNQRAEFVPEVARARSAGVISPGGASELSPALEALGKVEEMIQVPEGRPTSHADSHRAAR